MRTHRASSAGDQGGRSRPCARTRMDGGCRHRKIFRHDLASAIDDRPCNLDRRRTHHSFAATLASDLRLAGTRGRTGRADFSIAANIYLHPIDRLTATLGYRMVRYADDFVILAATSKEASRALRDIERLLRNRGLSLNRQKTRIVAPGETINFLGHTIATKDVTGAKNQNRAAFMPSNPAPATTPVNN